METFERSAFAMSAEDLEIHEALLAMQRVLEQDELTWKAREALVWIDRAIEAGLTFRPLADTTVATVDYWNSLSEERRAKPKAGCPPELEKKVLEAWHARGEE